MATHQIKFGDLVLTGNVETLTETIDNRVNIQEIANRHGGVVTDIPVLDARIVRMTGKIQDDDPEVLRDTLLDMESELGTTRQRLHTLFDDRYFNAYKDKFTYRYVPGTGMRVAEFAIEFLCDDPFEYTSTAPASVVITLTTADTPVGGGRYKESTSIVYGGTAISYLTVVTAANQAAALTQVYVRNLTLAREFRYDGAVAIGQSLTVSHGDFTVVHSANGNEIRLFTGAFIYLQPGTNVIEVQGEPATYTISYSQRYY